MMAKRKASTQEVRGASQGERKSRRLRDVSPELNAGAEASSISTTTHDEVNEMSKLKSNESNESTQRQFVTGPALRSATEIQDQHVDYDEPALGTNGNAKLNIPRGVDDEHGVAKEDPLGASASMDGEHSGSGSISAAQTKDASAETLPEDENQLVEFRERLKVSKATQTTPEELDDMVFQEDAESDYPDQEARVVAADSSSRPSIAILLNFHLSRLLQATARAGRSRREEERRSEKQLRLLSDFKEWVCAQQTKLWRLSIAHEKKHGSNQIVQQLQDKIQILAGKILKATNHEDSIEARTQVVETEATEAMRASAAALEKLFVQCELLGQASDDYVRTEWDKNLEMSYMLPDSVDDLLSAEELASLRLGAREQADIENGPGENDEDRQIPEQEPIQPDPILTAQLNAKDELRSAKNSLSLRQKEFDRRLEVRAKEYDELWNKLKTGRKAGETPEDFDLRHIKRGQELTRALIEAEVACQAAKKNAIDLDVDILSQTSGKDAPAAIMSCEWTPESLQKWKTDRRMLSWLEQVPAVGEGVLEADEEAYYHHWIIYSLEEQKHDNDTIAEWDSISQSGQVPHRIDRISEWRTHCEALRKSIEDAG